MRRLIVLFVLLFAMACLNCGKSVKAEFSAQSMLPSPYVEGISIIVNCTTASVTTQVSIQSNDTSLIRFPENSPMDDSRLENATSVVLWFSSNGSMLNYAFSNISLTQAETYAEGLTPSFNTVFSRNFELNSSGTYNDYVNVTYVDNTPLDLVPYAEWLIGECLNETVGGFSETFLNIITSEGTATIGIIATKEPGTFEWMYGIIVTYSSSIPTGTGEHTIDVLELLHSDSLAPSNCSYMGEYYLSTVMVMINSNETINFVSCEPPQQSLPMMRGWYITSLGNSIQGTFSFGDSSTPVTELYIKFSGKVVPEFTSIAILLVTFALVTLIALLKLSKKHLIFP